MPNLAQFDSLWDKTPTPEAGGRDRQPIPDGYYTARVEKAEWVEPDGEGSPYLSLVVEIDEGDHEGRWLFRRYYCDERGLGYLKKDLATLEIDTPKTLAELDLGKLLDVHVHVTKKTNKKKQEDGTVKEYANVYINRRIEPVHTTGVAVTPSNRFNDEDIPF